MKSNNIFPKRALISQSDRIGLTDFAKNLKQKKVEIISTGGTAKHLNKNNIDVTTVSSITKFPEILDGRVKTLHPNIHAGILANLDLTLHNDTLNKFNIKNIDLIAVNLYPFEEVRKNSNIEEKIIENIDIGGPTLIRAAAKNYKFKIVIVDNNDFSIVLNEMSDSKGVSIETRKYLATKAFLYISNYDNIIAEWFLKENEPNDYPKYFPLSAKLKYQLKYGENPHQKGAVYLSDKNIKGPLNAKLLQGDTLSYNNLNDADTAFNLVHEFSEPTVAIIKHANPCGVSSDNSIEIAWEKALKCDPVSAFGGIISLNKKVTSEIAKLLIKIYSEIIIAPEFSPSAIKIFKQKPKLKILETRYKNYNEQNNYSVKSINGGFLIQDKDNYSLNKNKLKTVTNFLPSDRNLQDMLFAAKVIKYVKSNAIVFAKNKVTIGIGAGQMSRIDSACLATKKTKDVGNYDLNGSVVASDAFLPFPDTLEHIYKAGAVALIQPGGSKKDSEIINLANNLKIAMVFSSIRNFNH